jgi:hypothetical protein
VVQAVLVGSVATFQFFCSFKKCFWCESDEFVSVHFVWIFANHFDLLAPAGAHASADALIMLKSSVYICVNKIWS